MLFALILSPGGHAAADMAFLLVFVQNLPDLLIQGRIMVLQPLGQVLMYGGLGNAELLRCGTNSGTGFDHVHSQVTGAPFNVIVHRFPSVAVCYRKIYAQERENMRP